MEAIQWFKNGDHPKDNCWMVHIDGQEDFPSEGEIVRYFRHPGISGETICPECNKIMYVHGWIDSGENGITVCPGDWVLTDKDNKISVCKPNNFFA